MDYKRIELLLEKYWECMTTTKEEEELRQFFNGNQVPSHLQGMKPLFEYQQEEREKGLDESFDQRILDEISGRQVKKNGLFFYWRVAAVMVLMLGAVWFARQNRNAENVWEVDTCQTPEQALQEVQKTLYFVSGKMNQGQQIVEKNMGKIETMTRYIK